MAVNIGLASGLANSYSGLSWTRSGTTITVTHNANLMAGGRFLVTASSDTTAIPLGYYDTNSYLTNTFTFTGVNAGGTSGTLSYSYARHGLSLGSVSTVSSMSFAFWAYMYDKTENMRFFDYDFSNGFRRFLINTPTFRFQAKFSTTDGNWSIPLSVTNLNQWHHFAITYNGASTANVPIIYVDGVSQTVTTQVTPVGTVQNNFGTGYLGTRATNDRSMNGRLAEYAHWSRILEAGEVTNLAAGAPPSRHMSSLVRYLPMLGNGADRIVASPATTYTSTGFTAVDYNTDHPRILYG